MIADIKNKKILVAMSGGVDSAVTAYLLTQAGAECTGATMMLAGDNTKDCNDAGAVADRLGIGHFVLDMRKEFRDTVVAGFIDEYEAGRTPNPCYYCNRQIKFGLFLERARELGFDMIATGHYADIDIQNGRFAVKKGIDSAKDQSYFLSGLSQEQLAHSVFPLGSYTKVQVREIAVQNGFTSSERRESQDVCFVPDGDYASVIIGSTGKNYPSGNFVTREGYVLGQHKGIIHYTVGQRRGLGLALPEPMYVCEKRMSDNSVVLCRDCELFTDTFIARDVNWMAYGGTSDPFEADVKIRYRHTAESATVTPLGGGRLRISFKTPQRAITSGQVMTAYIGDSVVCGGIIE